MSEDLGKNGKEKLLKLFEGRVPILKWLRSYTLEDAISDLIAGVTLGLTMIPQSIAYAALAGLSPQVGLSSSFVGCIIYAFFGTIKEVVIGPTSLMALLTYEYTSEFNMDFVILLSFLTGIVQFLMTVLRLGFLVDLISAPVVSGFTSATAFIIVVSQMKGLFGLNYKAGNFMDNLTKLYHHVHKLRIGDTILGIICIIFLLSLRKLKEVKVGRSVPCRAFLQKTFWFLSTGRNAITVLLCALLSYYYKSSELHLPFLTTKSGDTHFPDVRFPAMSTEVANTTYSFQDMLLALRSGYIVIPVVSVVANISIAKAFVNGPVDATQEMLTLALCNIAGSFIQAMPTTGAFTRSAVASASGVRTPIAGIYAACLTLMALGFLGPYFHLIPRATLSAILISAVIFLLDYEIVSLLWKNSWLDLVVVGLTVVSCMGLGVEIGLFIGMAVGLLHLIAKWARPKITVESSKTLEGSGGVRVTPETGMYFPAADYLGETIQKAALIEGRGRQPVIVDCSKFVGTDYTVAKSIKSLKVAFDKRGQPIHFVNVPINCYKLWIGSGCDKDLLSVMEDGHFSFGNTAIPLRAITNGEKDIALPEAEELLSHKT